MITEFFDWIKRLFKNTTTTDSCLECGVIIFTCPTCECKYDTEQDALRCADWDQILRHEKHYTHHLHKKVIK
jgi:hypothetical protein